MIYAETTADKKLDDLLSEYKDRDIDARLILFITAGDITVVSPKIYSVFSDKVVMGIHSFMFRHGALDKEGTVIMMIENEPLDFKYAYGLIENVSAAPVKNTLSIQKQIAAIHPGEKDTVCLEFCTNGEENLLTTLNAIMKDHGITVFGATAESVRNIFPNFLFYNGELYDDACIYLLIKNCCGHIATYSQNIYKHHEEGQQYIVTKVDRKTKTVLELDGRPAAEVYCEELGINVNDISSAYPYHPLIKCIGDQEYLVSIRNAHDDGSLELCKQINQNDLLCIGDLDDYKNIITTLFNRLKTDIPEASTIFTIDCIYRYMLFEQEGTLDWYTNMLNGSGLRYLGIIGAGEQYDLQHCNQTMISAIFDRSGLEAGSDTEDNVTSDIIPESCPVDAFSTEIRKLERQQRKENLHARIYPLEFMLDYVKTTKDNIVSKETAILKNVQSVQRTLKKLLDTDDHEEIKAFAQHMMERSQRMSARISMINMYIEDIGNMLDQTEDLINDVVYLDGLTGLLNRSFYNIMSEELFSDARKTTGLSMAFFDIDDFKHFNTEFGHDYGDAVLKELADHLKTCLKKIDGIYLIRMGGDEFVVLNPAAIPYGEFVKQMDMTREQISKHKILHDSMESYMSISVGMADSGSEDISSMWNLYRIADARLYDAKNAGKNQLKAYG